MMFCFPSSVALFLANLLGTVLCLLSGDFVFAWLSFELMSLSFIGLAASGNGVSFPAEGVAKYYLPNGFVNFMFLLGCLMYSASGLWLYALLVNVCLFVKLGLPPFHFWVPGCVKGLVTWLPIFILLGPQKLAPLHVLAQGAPTAALCIPVGVVTAWVAGAFSYNQCEFKKVLAYTSISMSGWMLVVSVVDPLCLYISWSVYTVSLGFLLYSANNSPKVVTGRNSSSLLLLLLVAGWPGGGGFSVKWSVLSCLVAKGLVLSAVALSGSSVMVVGVYCWVIVGSLLTPTVKVSFNSKPPMWVVAYLGGFYLGLPFVVYWF